MDTRVVTDELCVDDMYQQVQSTVATPTQCVDEPADDVSDSSGAVNTEGNNDGAEQQDDACTSDGATKATPCVGDV